jgi:enoyl-CoA hydratase/carnithine racemase
MTVLDDYRESYRDAKLTRTPNGVLEVIFHTNAGPLVWSERVHREFPRLFADIAADPENRVVILTGTGEVFCQDAVYDVWEDMDQSPYWDKLYVEGKRLLENLLNIDVPVIGAVNGPVGIHGELLVLSDIVLATEDTTFSDGHVPLDMVPGDGVHVVWPMLLGPNRARYFLLTGEKLAAAEALQLGIVQEILPRDELLARARDLADQLSRKSLLTLRGARVVLTQRIKRHLLDDLGYGLLFESRAAVRSITRPTDWTGREHLQ